MLSSTSISFTGPNARTNLHWLLSGRLGKRAWLRVGRQFLGSAPWIGSLSRYKRSITFSLTQTSLNQRLVKVLTTSIRLWERYAKHWNALRRLGILATQLVRRTLHTRRSCSGT